ncbi:hypothetical protein [Flagellimonas sp. S3867]|uniref:hypothetical protein n=1 Tax=Flagellimonas sp. S3867 TaxID=2768063 RepID=UPI00168A19E6|nr:hypothetical protein [Flagellimonas sp. S3867]
MLWNKTNIENKLQNLKSKQQREQEILEQVKGILDRDSRHGQSILSAFKGTTSEIVNNFDFELLETNNIFHIDQIKQICIDYRLRFLDSRYFKGEIPQAAISKIKRLEKLHNLQLGGFKIMAPSKMFKLKDKDDPLLFAPIGNDYFYLIHKWGNDLHPIRKILVWPFKSIVNLAFFVLLISYLTTILVPHGLFSKNDSHAEFWIIFFFMFKCIAAVVIFYGFALGKNFNPAIWNSRYNKA